MTGPRDGAPQVTYNSTYQNNWGITNTWKLEVRHKSTRQHPYQKVGIIKGPRDGALQVRHKLITQNQILVTEVLSTPATDSPVQSS